MPILSYCFQYKNSIELWNEFSVFYIDFIEIFTASKADGCWMCEKKDALSFIDSCVFLGAVSFAIFLDAQEARDAATRIYRIGFFMLKVL